MKMITFTASVLIATFVCTSSLTSPSVQQNRRKISRTSIYSESPKTRARNKNPWDPVSEIVNGRAAMFGIAAGLLNEMFTGKTLLEQCGLNYDSQANLFIGLSVGLCIGITSNLWENRIGNEIRNEND